MRIILPGEHIPKYSNEFDLLVSAESIYRSGTYNDTIELRTNSKAQAIQKIPFTLNVTGTPVIKVVDKLEWKDVIFEDGLELTQKFKIYNTGHESLSISKIISSGLEKLTLYNSEGNKIVKNNAGTLLRSIDVDPWSSEEVELLIPVSQFENVSGSISLEGNFEDFGGV